MLHFLFLLGLFWFINYAYVWLCLLRWWAWCEPFVCYLFKGSGVFGGSISLFPVSPSPSSQMHPSPPSPVCDTAHDSPSAHGTFDRPPSHDPLPSTPLEPQVVPSSTDPHDPHNLLVHPSYAD